MVQNWSRAVNGWWITNYLCIWGKTECILFGSKRKLRKAEEFYIECNGHKIKAQNSVKYLGLNLDNQLSGEAIVNNIVQKVNARLKFLYRQCSFLEEKLRKSVCSALIQCHLDYACSSWYSGLNRNFKKKLHICQNKTVRFIKNLGPRSHIGFSELDSLGMLNVDFRVKQLRLGHAHKIFNDRCPSYLSENFVKTSDIHRHNTRGSSENFVVPSVSGVAATTFYYSAIKDWNSLPSEVKIRSNYNSFKGAAKAYLRTQLQLREADNFIYY